MITATTPDGVATILGGEAKTGQSAFQAEGCGAKCPNSSPNRPHPPPPPPVIPPHLRPDKTHKKQFILHEKTIHTSLQRERIKKIASECIWSFTWTFQAIFSHRRALLIHGALKWSLFRSASLLDGPGWWLLGQWSGHGLVNSSLARQTWATLAEVAYFCGAERSLGQAVM